MELDRVCGTCIYGAEAYDRYGDVDPNYVICQIKEAENRGRKPNRFATISAVSRMHHQRDACLQWRPRHEPEPRRGEHTLKMHQWDSPGQTSEPIATATEPAHTAPPLSDEVKQLKLKLIQQEQMITSLQTQNLFLSEQLTETQATLEQTRQKLEKLQPFDPAIFVEVNYFSLLGISEKASPEEIKEAYRQRMKFLHPDRFINISQRLNTAYETLMDPQKRQKYLQEIRNQSHG